MGWSDISISLSGPVVNSLIHHFTDRWNYIFNHKYLARAENKYAPLDAALSQEPPTGDSFRDVHQRFHHGMRRAMGMDGSEERRDVKEDGGQANIQLTRRYVTRTLSFSKY